MSWEVKGEGDKVELLLLMKILTIQSMIKVLLNLIISLLGMNGMRNKKAEYQIAMIRLLLLGSF
ncbi:hypothetical protein HMPREF0663_10565 [Hoylesella oralis ATCC 33269]|jgi:hypothetical protein|uniref:Uncharacterized protein n=1 Tax=Hoylesella oralis ATCC 33269 TaxID=873533 RepID=E7RN65_9BACT|nr:hypothetical protein HMPREF0663_10565 [Hoylesella oralis ATCC 33269]